MKLEKKFGCKSISILLALVMCISIIFNSSILYAQENQDFNEQITQNDDSTNFVEEVESISDNFDAEETNVEEEIFEESQFDEEIDAVNLEETDTLEGNTIERPEEIPDWLKCNENIESNVDETVNDIKSFDAMVSLMSDTSENTIATIFSSKLLLIQTSLPWSSNANTAMLSTLVGQGYLGSYDVVSMSDVSGIELNQYNVVMLANDQTTDSYNQYSSIRAKLENYASGGGIVLFGACDEGWGGNGTLADTLPGNVKKIHSFENNNYIADADSPIITGSLTASSSIENSHLNGNYCSHTSFDESTLPAGSNIILRAGSDGMPTLVEYPYGNGMIIASGLTWEYYYGNIGSYSYYAYKDLVVYAISMNNNVTTIPVLTSSEKAVENSSAKEIQQWASQSVNFSVDFGDIEGPSINIWDHRIPLFALGSVAMKWSIADSFEPELEIDVEKKTIKVIFGLTDEAKAKIQDGKTEDNPTGDKRTQYGQEYQDIKKIYNMLVGGDLSNGSPQAWNEYRRIRSKLDKDIVSRNGQIGLEASIKVAGFMELSYETGELQISEGGFLVVGSTGGSYKYQPNIIYVTTGLTGKAELSIHYKYDNDGKTKGLRAWSLNSVEADISLDLNAAVGVGFKKIFWLDGLYLEGGVDGILGFEMDTSKLPIGDIYAQIKAYVKGKAGNFEITFIERKYPQNPETDDKWILWPRAKSDIQTYNSNDLIEVSGYRDIPRDYLDNAVTLAIDDLGKYEFNKKSVYPYTDQTLIELPDDRQMLVWVDDNGTKANIDRTTIMYSIFDGQKWTDSVAVYESGTYMDAPLVYSSENRTFVMWIQSDRNFSGEANIEDVLKSCDIYLAEFVEGKFSSPICISGESDGNYESSKTICLDSVGNIYVYWTENATSIFGDNGNTVIKTRSFINNEWTSETVVYETEQIVSTIVADYVNGSPTLYIVTLDKDFSSSLNILNNGEMDSIASNVGEVQIVDGLVYYVVGNQLYSYNANNGAVDSVISLANELNYCIVNNGTNIAIMAPISDGLYNDIYVSYLNNGLASDWKQFTNCGGYIRDYSAIMCSDGTLKIAVSRVDVLEDNGNYCYGNSADLFITGEQSFVDLSVSYLSYNTDQVIAGNNIELTFDVENVGNITAEGVYARLTDNNGMVVAEQYFDNMVNENSSNEFTINYQLPNVIAYQQITLTIYNAADINQENDSVTTEIGLADLSLNHLLVDAVGYESGMFSGEIVNSGYTEATNVILNVYSDAIKTKIIKTINLGTVKAQSNYTFKEDLPTDLMRVSAWGTMNALYFDVQTDSIESDTSNNNGKVAFGTLANTKAKFVVYSGEDTYIYSFNLSEDYAFPEELIAPERNGYFFAGWYLDEKFTIPFDINTFPEQDITIYARWLKAPMVTAMSNSYTSIHINWELIQSAETYEIQKYNTESASYETMYTGNRADYYEYNLITGKLYKYRVRMIRTTKNGKVQYSNYKNISVRPKLDVVTDFSAESNSTTSISLKWNLIEGATGYSIYRLDEESGEYILIKKIIDSNISSWINGGLKFNAVYSYKIRAYREQQNEKIYSAFSSIAKARTVLNTVQNINATTYSSTSIKLQWDSVLGADGYYIYIYDFEAKEYSLVKKIISKDINNVVIGGLVAGNYYEYAMQAYCEIDGTKNYSNMSENVSIEVLPPTFIRSAVSSEYNQIQLNWKKANIGVGYEIFKSTKPDGEYELVDRVWEINQETYSFNNLDVGTTYYFKIRVFDTSHDLRYSPLSAATSCKTMLSVPKFEIISDGTMAIFHWQKVAGATGYYIYEYSGENDRYTMIKKITNTEIESWSLKNLSLGQTYTFAMKAYREDNSKKYYSNQTDNYDIKMVLAAPENFVVMQTSNSSVSLSWNIVNDAAGYYVYCLKPDSEDYSMVQKISSGKINSWVQRNLDLGKVYKYRVRAFNKSELGNYYSNYSNVETVKLTLNQVQGVDISATGSNSLELKWNPVEGADGYYIYRSTNQNDYVLVKKITSGDTTAWTNKNLQYGATYSYKLKSYLKNDTGSYYGKDSECVSACVLEKVDEFLVSSYNIDTVRLSWKRIGVGEYEISRSTKLNGVFDVIGILSNDVTEYYDSNLEIGKDYYYTIRSVSAGYKGILSECQKVKVTMETPVCNVSATSVYTITLAWNEAKGATGYYIYQYDTDLNQYIAVKKINSGQVVSWKNLNLELNTEYRYKIRSFTTVNGKKYYSNYSDPIIAKTKLAVVNNFKATIEGEKVTFSWDSNSEATGYYVYNIKEEQCITVRKIMDNSQTSVTLKLTETGIYHFAMKAYTEINGTKYYSNITNTVDIEYYLTIQADASEYPESEHPYANSMDQWWSYNYQDAVKLDIKFSDRCQLENGCDKLYLFDANDNLVGVYTGVELAGATVTVPGESFKIRMTTDGSITYYGFSIDSIIAYEEKEGELSRLEIRDMPYKTEYCLGEEIELEGLKLNAIYDNNVIKTVEASQLENIIYDFSTAGDKSVVVSYGGISVECPVTVLNYYKIFVNKQECEYPESEHSYSNGMDKIWQFSYPNASSFELKFSNNTCFENNCDKLYLLDANDNIIGTYTGTELAGLTVTILGESFKIRMTTDGSVTYYGFSLDSIFVYEENGENLESLLIVQEPLTKVYCLNDDIDLSNLMLKAVYTNGVEKNISPDQLTDVQYDFSKLGETEVVLGYQGKFISYMVNIKSLNKLEVDFDLYNYLSSSHDYANYIDEMQIFTYEKSEKIKLEFSNLTYVESGCDKIYIYDRQDNEIGCYTGVELAGRSITVLGDTVKIRIKTDASTTGYGYSVDRVYVYLSTEEIMLEQVVESQSGLEVIEITTEESSETTIEESSETIIEESSETTIEESSETIIEESSETIIEESSETIIEESSETTIEESSETIIEELNTSKVPCTLYVILVDSERKTFLW